MNIITTIQPFLKIIQAIIILILAYISIKIVYFIINKLKFFEQKLTLIYAFKDLSKYIIAVIALILIFNIFGIDLKGIFISIGIVGIAISFAAKDIISNFMSGFFLIADKTLEIGDVMQINNLKGEVKKIGLRNTVILTETGDTIIIPNSSLSTNPYSRFKKGEIEKVSLNVTAPLNIDISDFKNEIEEIINKNEGILKTPKPKIESKGIDENGTLLKIMFWVKNFNKKEDNKLIITNQVREIINKKLGDDN